MEELLKLPSLQSLDLKNNQISHQHDKGKVVEFFAQMQ
jgi:hypothetical protein